MQPSDKHNNECRTTSSDFGFSTALQFDICGECHFQSTVILLACILIFGYISWLGLEKTSSPAAKSASAPVTNVWLLGFITIFFCLRDKI